MYKTYLPLVATINPHKKSGYAWSCLEDSYHSLFNFTWYHRWQIEPDVTECNGVEFVQHFSCENRPFKPPFWQDQYKALAQLVAKMDGRSFNLLFLNEPDLADQCYRSPKESAIIYKRVLEIAPNATIIGPQPSHYDYLNDWQWLRGWVAEINKLGLPTPHHGSIHNYNLDPASQLESYFRLQGVSNSVWVTEFGSSSEQLLEQMIDVYKTDNRVIRYAYFNPIYDPSGNFYDNLLVNEREITQLGRTWVANHS